MTKNTFIFLMLLFLPTSLYAFELSDNFNSGEYGSIWDEYKGANVSIVDSDYDGKAVRIRYTGEGNGNYYLGAAVLSQNSTTVYTRFRFKTSGYASGGAKFLKLFGEQLSPTNYANITYGIDYNTGLLQRVSRGSGATTENDTAVNMSYAGPSGDYGADPLDVYNATSSAFDPNDGEWHLYESFVKYNDDDTRNGEVRVWIDGDERLHVTNVKMRHNDNSMRWRTVTFGGYCSWLWAEQWELFIDDVYISGEISRLAYPEDPTTPTTSGPILRTGTHLLRVGGSVLRVQ